MEERGGGGGEARQEVGVGMCLSSRKKRLKKKTFEAARSPQDTWRAGDVRNENGGEEMRADEE